MICSDTKKMVLGILACWILNAQIIQAQPFGDPADGFLITRMVYSNSTGEQAITEFHNSVAGRVISANWFLSDSSRSSINHYQYDANGLLVSAYRDFSDGLNSYESFEYDKKGHLTSEHFYRSDGRSGSAQHQYGKSGRTRSLLMHHKGWINGTVLYQYDSTGRKASAALFTDSVKGCDITYLYDDYGNLRYEKWDFNGRWSQEFTYIYTERDKQCNYYSVPYLNQCKGQRIKSEEYDYNGQNGGPSSYFYARDGTLRKKSFTRSDGLQTMTHYTYDSGGKLTTSHREYADGRQVRFTYDYNLEDNLIKRTGFSGDTIFSIEAYLYNEKGELEQANYQNMDGWITGIILYKYNGLGELSRAHFMGHDGFDANIFFRLNNDRLVEEVIWKFSFGAYQRYRYIYQ